MGARSCQNQRVRALTRGFGTGAGRQTLALWSQDLFGFRCQGFPGIFTTGGWGGLGGGGWPHGLRCEGGLRVYWGAVRVILRLPDEDEVEPVAR